MGLAHMLATLSRIWAVERMVQEKPTVVTTVQPIIPLSGWPLFHLIDVLWSIHGPAPVT